MSDPNEPLDIPDGVRVRCPKAGFKLARVAQCVDCPSFAGLEDRFPCGAHAFAQRYTVLCAHVPVKRELFEEAD